MGFQLVIAEGKETGREFDFDQVEVFIGRTPECDVILYESGVSRKHARIFIEANAFFIEDLGSSNGTKVNGATVQRQVLNDGDAIALGPVVFNFKGGAIAQDDATADEFENPEEGGAHTRVVSMSELKKARKRVVASGPTNASSDELQAMSVRNTSQMAPVKARTSNPKAAAPLARPARPAPLARDEETVEPRGLARPRPAENKGGQISASDRARLRRQGPSGTVKLMWIEASTAKRAIAVSVIALLVLAPTGAIAWALWPDAKPKAIEPTMLGPDPLEASFGLGDDVTFSRPDEKTFEFDVKSPVQVMGVVHYMSRDIGSKDEVSISVNGTEIGWLTPDTLDSGEREFEALIPTSLIKRNETNAVTFDNVKNPPDKDKWRVWHLWIEIAVLPEMDTPGLIIDAEEKFKKGLKKWEYKDVGAVNRWEAYKYFREAWLSMEALPASSRPPSYLLAREKMRMARAELDLKCNKLLLEARTAYSLNQFPAALAALQQVPDFFPTRQHPCQNRADKDRYDYGL
jgi:pSer/pThr/pTyr-binding forkhead associated (FHA) protein